MIWIYREKSDQGNQSTITDASIISILPFIQLTATQTQLLLGLAKSGDVQGIFEQLQELGKTNEQLKEFTTYLYQLAEQFEFEEICRILEMVNENSIQEELAGKMLV